MKKRLIRIASWALAFCLCLTMLPSVGLDVKAASYENTHTNTGNQAYDIVAVAQTQVGYQEGTNNYNKYSAAFGVNNVEWCAYFVSWCAKEAGISDSIIHRQGIASPFSGYFNIPNTHSSGSYFPKPGDLVFYGPNSKGDHYHVGIVETVNASTGYITTIEGNTNSSGSSTGYVVYRHTRHYQHSTICCYGTPKYTNTHTHNYSGARVYESAHPHEITQRCVDYATCGGWIYTGEYYEVKSCEQCWHADFNIDVSSVVVNVGESKTISASITGCWPDTVATGASLSPNNDVVKVNASNSQLIFTGLKVGTTKFTMTVYSDSSKSYVIGSKTISVTVTCSSHSYSYKVTTSPTTSSTGKLKGTCSKCSATTTVSLPKLSTTNYTYKVTKAATCTATGIGRYTWKTTTYGSFYFDVSIAAKGHSYSTKVTAPTCTAQGYTTHTCSACGNSYKDTYTNATGHSYNYKVTKTPATSATGTLKGTCSKCSGATTISLPKLNTTNYTYKVTKAATCTTTGIGRYTWKTTTYGSFYFDVTIDKLGHSYTTKITAPTCTAQGYTTHICSRCSDSYKDTYTNATGHSYSYKVTKTPTTSATGTLTGTCSKCNGTSTVSLPKLSTTNYTYKVTKAATCTATGTGRYTWKTTTYGSFYFDVSIPATGHNYSAKVTAPTCTAQGYTTHTCSACGNSYKDTYTDATTHNYSNGAISKQPTCKDTGVITYSCIDCGKTKTETIAKLTTHTYDHSCDTSCNVCGATRTASHQYKTSWEKDKTSHWHECSVCADKKDVASHVPGAEATETTAQKCTVCGYIIQAAIGHTHEYASEWATDENGHWYACVGCEETDSYAAHDFANACDCDCAVCGYTRDTTHNYGDVYKSDDSNHWLECSDCGEKKDVIAHEPGATATSTTTQTCTVCGHEIAPALGTTDGTAPSTEVTDATNATTPIEESNDINENKLPWWVILVVSCIGIAVVVVIVGKKKKER